MAKQRPVPARDGFVSINGLRLHYLEWGDRASPPVVLLHGGSAHAHWWDIFAEAIADAYHVVAIDLRGHGDSEHADPPTYRVHDFVRDITAFVDALQLDRIHLVGHSLGAMVATAYAAQAPQRLRSLVVVDSQLKVSAAGARYMLRLRNFPQPIYRDHTQAVQRFRLLPTDTAADEQTLAHIATHSLCQLPDARWTLKFDREALAQHEPQDLTPLLARITCPVLFVRGAHSTLLSHTALAGLVAAAPQARAVEVPAAHHHVMLDNPSEFERVVRTFIESAHAQRAREGALPSNP